MSTNFVTLKITQQLPKYFRRYISLVWVTITNAQSTKTIISMV